MKTQMQACFSDLKFINFEKKRPVRIKFSHVHRDVWLFLAAVAIVGFVWFKLGYQYVFLIGALIAVLNLFSALQIRIPQK